MTKVELEKEAIEYVCKENPLVIKGWFIEAFKKYDKGKKVKYLKDCEIAEYEAYLAGAEPREKRIAELEAQIEKMKCCGNCKKLRGRFDSKTNINILYCSDSDMKQIEVGFQMCCCKWEIKEK